MLEDFTSGHHTYLDWNNEHGKQEKYSLQGDPRRRVIPQAKAKAISICFGIDISFTFFWRDEFNNERDIEEHRKELARIAASMVVPGNGSLLTVVRDPKLDPTAYEARTTNTPVVPEDFDGKPLRQTHVYSKLGEGGFGTVFKAVDLSTGSVWAVKECRKPRQDVAGEDWKLDFKREVEKLASLRHVSSS